MSTLKRRLESKLRREPNGCLVFTGAKSYGGYGKIYSHSVGKRTVILDTHRAAWELANGPIPDGVCVLHHCDNPSCCNVEHLFLGTQADNMQDKSSKGRALPGPVSRPEWWTPERRAQHSAERKQYKAALRAALATDAGHPPDWLKCPTCKTWKPPTMFGPNRARETGLQAHCKPCKHEADIERVRRNKGLSSVPRRATRSDKKFF